MNIKESAATILPLTIQPVVPDLSDGLDDMMKKQLELEQYAVNWGVERFNTRLEKVRSQEDEAQFGAAKKLMQMALDPTIKAIDEFVYDQMEGRKARGQGGQKHCSLRFLEMLGHREAAYLTIKVILDSITKTIQVRTAAQELTTLIMDELKFRRFRDKAPGLFAYKMQRFTTSNYAHMARSMSAAVNFHNVNAVKKGKPEEEVDTSDLDVTDRQRLLIGIKLIDLCKLATGMFDIEKSTKVTGHNAVKTEYTIKATDETIAWLADRNSALQQLWPVNLPMVVPPLAWQPGRRGGYRFNLRGKHFLVRGISKKHAERLAQTEMPTVYNAINRIQETPWTINRKVVALLEQIWTMGGDMAGIPAAKDAEDIPKPDDIDTNEPARKKWRKEQWALKEANHQRQLDAVDFGRFMSIVNRFKNEDALWFPHNIDFRGRIYPVTNFLSPQGDDRSKGVLKFAQGKALGQSGAAWLALHGANCLGVTPDKQKLSKMTLEDRVEWIRSHTDDIVRAAEEPLVHRWWADADDPLQFIAFCFEWTEFNTLCQEGLGHEYVSSLACGMDGTCNGLQHYSAMLRDPVGAAAVNVTPSARPQDIYQNVMDAGIRMLERDATENELARMWLKSGLCERKLAKPNVMTFAYGSKQFGFRKQIIDYVSGRKDYHEKLPIFESSTFLKSKVVEKEQEEIEETMEHSENPTHWMNESKRIQFNNMMSGELDGVQNVFPHAASYMAKVMWDSLGDVVVAAQQGMSWMQKCARLIAKHGKCVEWRVPGTGYMVTQEYVKEKEGHIETVLAGRAIQCRVYTKTETPDPAKQGNAIAPNIVHSLDAAALMLTVELCASNGIECFHMVHDSYGVLAADAPLMANTLRRAFYMLYSSNDVVGSLYEQFKAQLPESEQDKLPKPPEKGSLDLALVLESPYFFC